MHEMFEATFKIILFLYFAGKTWKKIDSSFFPKNFQKQSKIKFS